ncbi:MAG: hypothetical protein ACREGJ_00410 [Candidatus Saccharimonadales bacterium]
MLKIKKSLLEFDTDKLKDLLPHQHMQLSPVTNDDVDELVQAIANEAAVQDDKWDLAEVPDAQKIANFWDQAVQDLKNDPEWVDLNEQSYPFTDGI